MTSFALLSISLSNVNTRRNDDRWVDELLAPFEPVLSVADAAAALRVSPKTVRKLLVHRDPQRRLPAVKFGKEWRIMKPLLREYLLVHQNDSSTITKLTAGGGNA